MRLFNRYYTGYDLLLVVGDFALVFAIATAARAVIFWDNMPVDHGWSLANAQALAMGVIVVIAFYYSDLYAIDQTLSLREMLLRFMGGLGVACIVIGVISYPIPNFGKSIYLSEMTLLAAVLGLWRIGFMSILKGAAIRSKVLIVGVQAIGKLVASELCKEKKLGMQIVGFVGSTPDQIRLAYGNPVNVSLPVFAPESLYNLIEEHKVDRILLAGAESCNESVVNELVRARARGIPVEDCHSFYERLASKIAIPDLSPEWIVLSRGFDRSKLLLATKRVLDVLVSALGLLLSAPISLLAVIAIKIDSPGAIFYRQERVGQGERVFTLYKFRSMQADAEASGEPVWASEEDPRITRVGRTIRKFRIDEIPQMFNVLKGEMSFVGPRPERPHFVEQLKAKIPFYFLRHSVKPGITGWAQISYPYTDSDESAIEKLQYDLYYIKHMSPIFDLQIMIESFKVILLGRGAR